MVKSQTLGITAENQNTDKFLGITHEVDLTRPEQGEQNERKSTWRAIKERTVKVAQTIGRVMGKIRDVMDGSRDFIPLNLNEKQAGNSAQLEAEDEREQAAGDSQKMDSKGNEIIRGAIQRGMKQLLERHQGKYEKQKGELDHLSEQIKRVTEEIAAMEEMVAQAADLKTKIEAIFNRIKGQGHKSSEVPANPDNLIQFPGSKRRESPVAQSNAEVGTEGKEMTESGDAAVMKSLEKYAKSEIGNTQGESWLIEQFRDHSPGAAEIYITLSILKDAEAKLPYGESDPQLSEAISHLESQESKADYASQPPAEKLLNWLEVAANINGLNAKKLQQIVRLQKISKESPQTADLQVMNSVIQSLPRDSGLRLFLDPHASAEMGQVVKNAAKWVEERQAAAQTSQVRKTA